MAKLVNKTTKTITADLLRVDGRDGSIDATFDLEYGWVTPKMGTASQIVAAGRAQAGGGVQYWLAYGRTLIDAGYPA